MKTSTLFKVFFLLPAMFICTNTIAQDSADDDENEGVLEEVLITATRRGESNIMTTPISITALSGEEVDRFALRDLNDIAVSVPGLSAGTVSAFKSAQFAMRGVSEQTIIVYKESPVGVTVIAFELVPLDITAVPVLALKEAAPVTV